MTTIPLPNTARRKPATTLRALRAQAANCRACPLWKTGTQTVFGDRRLAREQFVRDLKVAAQAVRVRKES